LIIYVGLSCRESGFISRVVRMGLVSSCVYALLDFELLLFSNSIDLASNWLKIILAQSGVGQLAVKLPAATVVEKMQVLDSLFLSPALFFALQIFGVACALLLCTCREVRGIVAAVGTALAISVHHVFLLTLALPTYSGIWAALVTAATLVATLAVLQKWLSVRDRSLLAAALMACWALAAAGPRVHQFRLVAADYYISVGEGVELQQQTWQRISKLIGLRTVDRVNVLSSAMVCLDTEQVWRNSFDLSRIWYDTMRVVQVNTDYLEKFDIVVLKVHGQERVPQGTLTKLLQTLPACGFRPVFQNSMVSVFGKASQFSSEAFE